LLLVSGFLFRHDNQQETSNQKQETTCHSRRMSVTA